MSASRFLSKQPTQAPYTFEFEIPDLPKLPNQLLGANWRTRASNKKKWGGRVALATNQFKPPYPLNRATLELTRYSSVQPDHDGLVGSFKPILDALVDLDILVDDTTAVIGVPIYLWKKTSPGKGKITIKIEEREK